MPPDSTPTGFSGAIPQIYHEHLGPLLFEFPAVDIAERVAKAAPGAKDILEVACGTGVATRRLAQALDASIVATDVNSAMLEEARRVNGDLARATFAEADALDLPFDDERFDAVVCQFGVMFFPDKAQGMREMARVLRPGGVVALNVWRPLAENPAAAIANTVIGRFFESDPPRFLAVPFSFSDEGALRSLCADAGFAGVEFASVAEAVEVLDFVSVARGFVTGNPTALEVEARAEVDTEAVVDAVTKALEAEFGPPPAKLPFRAVACLARKPAA